jgi:hypothetical protein
MPGIQRTSPYYVMRPRMCKRSDAWVYGYMSVVKWSITDNGRVYYLQWNLPYREPRPNGNLSLAEKEKYSPDDLVFRWSVLKVPALKGTFLQTRKFRSVAVPLEAISLHNMDVDCAAPAPPHLPQHGVCSGYGGCTNVCQSVSQIRSYFKILLKCIRYHSALSQTSVYNFA